MALTDDYSAQTGQPDDSEDQRMRFILRSKAKPVISPIMTAQGGNGRTNPLGTGSGEGAGRGVTLFDKDEGGLSTPNAHSGNKPLGSGSTPTNRLGTDAEFPVYSSTKSSPAFPGQGSDSRPNVSSGFSKESSGGSGRTSRRGQGNQSADSGGVTYLSYNEAPLSSPNVHGGTKELGSGGTPTNKISTSPQSPVYSSTPSNPSRPTRPGSGDEAQPEAPYRFSPDRANGSGVNTTQPNARFAASRPNIPAARFTDTNEESPTFPATTNGRTSQLLGVGGSNASVLGRGTQPARPDVMPQRSDFPEKKLPTWERVLGLAAAPFVPALSADILTGPRRAADRQFTQATQDWEREQQDELRQSQLANVRSEIAQREKPKEPTTTFEAWRQQNPDAPVSEYMQLEAGTKQEGKQPPLTQSQIGQANAIHQKRFQTLNPGQPLPAEFTLRPGSTKEDYDMVDKNLTSMESAAGTQAQRESTNAFRSQQAADAAERRDQARQDREDKESALQVFAVDPRTKQRSLMSVGEAKAQGIRSYQKVSQPDIEKETSLNSQMNDMQLNTSRYRAALNAMGQLSPQDRSAMTRILSDKAISGYMTNELTLGALMDQISQGEKGRAWNRLSPDKQEALIGYLRMKNTGLLAQKVLTGMGRASKEAWQVEIDNMPSPIEGATVGSKKLDAWQDNLDQINSRSVKLPWMEQPSDVRARVEGQATQQYNQRQAGRAQPQQTAPKSIHDRLVNFLNQKMGAQ